MVSQDRATESLWWSRPPLYSRTVWPLILLLDALPYPRGEDILARLFVVKAFVQIRRLREAMTWAARHARGRRARWRLALQSCAYHGRFVARVGLVGVRRPEDFRRQIKLRGVENLGGTTEPTIFLAFHLGPPKAALALNVAGLHLTWLGGRSSAPAWWREAWRPFRDAPGGLLSQSEADLSRTGILLRARELLQSGQSICITADSETGREAFRVALPGGPVLVRSGWLSVRRVTGARVVPVLTHMEGRTQVVTIHPPLPPPLPDLAADMRACGEAIRPLLEEHIRRVPEQCYMLAFRPKQEACAAPGRTGERPESSAQAANRESV